MTFITGLEKQALPPDRKLADRESKKDTPKNSLVRSCRITTLSDLQERERIEEKIVAHLFSCLKECNKSRGRLQEILKESHISMHLILKDLGQKLVFGNTEKSQESSGRELEKPKIFWKIYRESDAKKSRKKTDPSSFSASRIGTISQLDRKNRPEGKEEVISQLSCWLKKSKEDIENLKILIKSNHAAMYRMAEQIDKCIAAMKHLSCPQVSPDEEKRETSLEEMLRKEEERLRELEKKSLEQKEQDRLLADQAALLREQNLYLEQKERELDEKLLFVCETNKANEEMFRLYQEKKALDSILPASKAVEEALFSSTHSSCKRIAKFVRSLFSWNFFFTQNRTSLFSLSPRRETSKAWKKLALSGASVSFLFLFCFFLRARSNKSSL